MKAREFEEFALDFYREDIQAQCRGVWRSIEWEDRLEEAYFVFLCTLRTPRVTEKTLWPLFLQTLPGHMNPLNQKAGKTFSNRSMDAPLGKSGDRRQLTLLDCIASSQHRASAYKVQRFLAQLPEIEQDFCILLLRGASPEEAGRALSLSPISLMQMRQMIGQKYLAFDTASID